MMSTNTKSKVTIIGCCHSGHCTIQKLINTKINKHMDIMLTAVLIRFLCNRCIAGTHTTSSAQSIKNISVATPIENGMEKTTIDNTIPK